MQVIKVCPQANGIAIAGNTYAVITGIAHYENKNIPNLNFSNRDALLFAQYLQSEAGGAVPKENIRLLIDSSATTAALYNALRWLKEKCQRDAEEQSHAETTVYFYFSGHGDLENETLSQLGYLLAYNTPSNNYINNALRIEDLNDYAHLFSVKFKAKVVLITDACHSGTLAGNKNRGTYLVGQALSTAKENEIRIASCLPEEVSNEHEGWGDGRGVFSYYFINGLKGLADYNKDRFITLDEIKKYLEQSIPADPIIRENNLKQTPVLKGQENFRMASVHQQELELMQASLATPAVQLSDQEYFVSSLKKADYAEKIDFEKINRLPPNEIPFQIISAHTGTLPQTIQEWDEMSGRFRFVPNADVMRFSQFAMELHRHPEQLSLFNEMLVETLHTIGQRVINLYLQGDVAEMEKRRYYNSAGSGYDQYPAMYEVAMKLTDKENPLYRIMQVNHYYFKAVSLRLKIPMVIGSRQKQLGEQALTAAKKALALEKEAAYIYNELGMLHQSKKEYTAAKKYFEKATEISPVWALPWANLCGLYAEMNKPDDALQACQMAEALQAEMQVTAANLGVAYEKKGNLLLAEEFYRKAIDINSRHYLPFERLGFVYLKTTTYALADSFFFEASLRRKGYHFNGNQWAYQPMAMVAAAAVPTFCGLDTAILIKEDVMAFFYWALKEYERRNYSNADRIFRRVISVDKSNPLAFHYLGKVYYDQQKWEEAELMFQLAVNYYLDEDAFSAYCDSVIRKGTFPYDHSCFEKVFMSSYYNRLHDYSFLASLYEQWDHTEEAEVYYKKIMAMAPHTTGAYARLWRLLEKQNRYAESEAVIKSLATVEEETSYRELHAFYKRAVQQHPEQGDWHHRLALLLYEKMDRPARAAFLDTIIYFPLAGKEIFIDERLYRNFRDKPDMVIDGEKLPGGNLTVALDDISEPMRYVALPGIEGETILMEGPVYTPRRDAITYLKKAMEFIAEPERLADLHFKTGNVFVRAGSVKQAYPFFAKSVQWLPGNIAARMKMADVCISLYKNREAMEQLGYLYDNSRINFAQRMLLAEFSIHAADFVKGKKLLDEAGAIHPYPLPEVAGLNGRMNLMQKKYVQAISFYKNYLQQKPADPQALYSIAVLYAKSGNKNEAWKWLRQALQAGFNYSLVLDADASWIQYRHSMQWAALLKKYPMKKYSSPSGLLNKVPD